MLRIGEFSRLTRLSVRMLRHYDAHNVLSPACVDDFTGYRFYRPDQVADAVLIRQLRDVGFSVSAIAALLPISRDLDVLGRALRVQRDHLIAEADATRARLAHIDLLISNARRATMATITTTVHPAHRIVALRGTIPTYTDEGDLWQRIMAAARGIRPAGPCGATFYDPEYKETDVDVEVWLQVAPYTEAPELLEARDVPEQRVAVATFSGPYEQISDVCAELAGYLEKENLTMAGPGFTRYLTGPTDTDDPAQYLTELCWPVN